MKFWDRVEEDAGLAFIVGMVSGITMTVFALWDFLAL